MVWIESVRSVKNQIAKTAVRITPKAIDVVTRLIPMPSTRLSEMSVPTMLISTTVTQ
jgi:hypothetical protein